MKKANKDSTTAQHMKSETPDSLRYEYSTSTRVEAFRSLHGANFTLFASGLDLNKSRRSLRHQNTWRAQRLEPCPGRLRIVIQLPPTILISNAELVFSRLTSMSKCELWEDCVAISYLPQLSKRKMKSLFSFLFSLL